MMEILWPGRCTELRSRSSAEVDSRLGRDACRSLRPVASIKTLYALCVGKPTCKRNSAKLSKAEPNERSTEQGKERRGEAMQCKGAQGEAKEGQSR